MARKKENLTLKEKLEQSLVPPEEQPYEIPKNWAWIKLPSSFFNVTSSNKKLQQKNYLNDGKYAVVDQGKELIGGYSNDENLLYDKLLPVILFGDHTRIIKFLNFPFIQGADGVKLLKPRRIWCEKCFYYALLNVEIKDLGYRRHFSLFPSLQIPLPPFNEQQRIVNRIESLFEKLDKVKELAQNALDTFENRKSAFLHKAFTGELTKKWREENCVSIDSWEVRTLQSVCSEKITDGTHQTPKYTDEANGVPFISAKDVTSGTIAWSNIKYITKELHEVLYKRVAPQIDDILLAKNGTTGVAAIVNTDKVFNIYVTLAMLRPNKNVVTPKFLYYIVNSPVCKEQFDANLTGIGVPNLHLRDIKEIVIKLPPIAEQDEIVRLTESIFEKEQQAKELIDVIEKIDIIKKSILARAFRGELGTNNKDEESAIELLKECLLEED